MFADWKLGLVQRHFQGAREEVGEEKTREEECHRKDCMEDEEKEDTVKLKEINLVKRNNEEEESKETEKTDKKGSEEEKTTATAMMNVMEEKAGEEIAEGGKMKECEFDEFGRESEDEETIGVEEDTSEHDAKCICEKEEDPTETETEETNKEIDEGVSDEEEEVKSEEEEGTCKQKENPQCSLQEATDEATQAKKLETGNKTVKAAASVVSELKDDSKGSRDTKEESVNSEIKTTDLRSRAGKSRKSLASWLRPRAPFLPLDGWESKVVEVEGQEEDMPTVLSIILVCDKISFYGEELGGKKRRGGAMWLWVWVWLGKVAARGGGVRWSAHSSSGNQVSGRGAS